MRGIIFTGVTCAVLLSAFARPALGQFGGPRPVDLTPEQAARVVGGGGVKRPAWMDNLPPPNPGGYIPPTTPDRFPFDPQLDPQHTEYETYCRSASELANRINAEAKRLERPKPPGERDSGREKVNAEPAAGPTPNGGRSSQRTPAVSLWLAWGCLAAGVLIALAVLFKWRGRRAASVLAAALLAFSALPLTSRWWPSTNTDRETFSSVATPFAELKAGLKHPSPKCRMATVWFLKEVVPAVGTPAVLAIACALDDEDANVGHVAGMALFHLGPLAKDATPALVAELKKQDSWRVRNAASALSTAGGGPAVEEAITLLTGIVKAKPGENEYHRAFALTALNKLAKLDVVLPVLIAALDDPQPDVAQKALIGLAAHGPAAKAALPRLMNILEGKRAQTAAMFMDNVMRTLAKIGPDALPPLLELLKRRTWSSGYAAEAIGMMGADAKPAVPALVEALTSAGPDGYRDAAVKGLGLIGPAASEAVPQLITLMLLDPRNPKNSFADALGKIGGEKVRAVVPRLLELMKETPDPGGRSMTRGSVIDCLGSLGSEAQDAVPEMVKALRECETDKVWKIYEWSLIKALGSIGPAARQAVPVLTAILNSSKAMNREELEAREVLAVIALGRIGPAAKEAIPVLLAMRGNEKLTHHLQYVDQVVIDQAIKLIDPAAAKQAGIN